MTDTTDVITALSDFYTPEEAQEWLYRPNILLQGEAPIDLLETGRKARLMQVITQVTDGIYI
jgi:uncharacterized protein (DUF2384 family)